MPVTSRTICPLCEASATFVYKESHADAASGVTYDLFECSACTGQFFEPLKNPGAEWYSHDERYADRNRAPIMEPQWNHRETIARLAPSTGSVLDVGCGVGNFLAHAVSRGWQATGIDFDADAVAAGKEAFGLKELSVDDIHGFRAKHPGRQFDLVTFFDVLEHVDDHAAFLSAVRSLVKDGGAIALSVPHRAHAKFLMPADVPPRHLTRWDERSLSQVLAHHGFKASYLKAKGEGVRYVILKLRFRFGKRLSMGLVGKARGAGGGKKRAGWLVKAAQLAASTKDAILFGIPALVIWLILLPTRKRYLSLFVIAEKLPQTP